MRLFQFISAYKPYLQYFETRYPEAVRCSFSQRLDLFLGHRYYASHILQPVYERNSECFFTVGNDALLQKRWARENGLRTDDLLEILRAQIEHHGAEVLYSLDPLTFDSRFLKTLPGSVKRAIAWNASPSGNADLSGYHKVVSNFPYIREFWKEKGCEVAHFFPAHDERMDAFAGSERRPVDVCFVGQYADWWQNRNRALAEISRLAGDHLVSFRLLAPKWKALGRSHGLNRIKLPIHYLPDEIRAITGPPVYGLELYELFSTSKIVFNATVDSAVLPGLSNFRGNMRCFEALGCGACMVSDAGTYSDGFQDGTHFISYRDGVEIAPTIQDLLRKPDIVNQIAKAGQLYVREKFSKEKQWNAFKDLLN